jgi:hypothetical protein
MEGKDNDSVLAWGASVIADQAKKVGQAIKDDLTKGSGPAIGREAIKDVRGTVNQVFFGQAEGVGEPGAPLNPLQSEVAEQRKEGADSLYGKDDVHGGKVIDPKRLPSPAEVAKEKRLYQKPADHGNAQTAAIEPESFTERLMRERRKTDEDATGQNERAKGRSLPDEQREKDKERGR